MDEDRLELHAFLEQKFPGLTIYYNPPSKTILTYPCIVYTLDQLRNTHANNKTYMQATVFQVSVLSITPGLLTVDAMLTIPGSTHIRSFINEDVVNDIFKIQTKAI